MSLRAEIQMPEGEPLRVLNAALHHGLGVFPRLWVWVETDEVTSTGPCTFTLTQTENGRETTVHTSIWYVTSFAKSALSQNNSLDAAYAAHRISLRSDALDHQQLGPFAANHQDAQTLLSRHLSPHVSWQGVGYTPQPIEALISRGETLEQLARRVAQLTNAIFKLQALGETGWALQWASKADALVQVAQSKQNLISPGHTEMLQSNTTWLEASVQQLSVPSHFGEPLLTEPTGRRMHQLARMVQLGLGPDKALVQAPPQAEDAQSLVALHTQWSRLTQLESLPALWESGVVALDSGEEAAIVVSSLFIYENDTREGRTGAALNDWAQFMGGESTLSMTAPQGWEACLLCVPLQHMPADKQLLEHAMDILQPDQLWSRMVERMGCGRQQLTPPPASMGGLWPAVVVNRADSEDPMGRSEDTTQYRSKIWVRPLGCDSAVEIDFATPIANRSDDGDGDFLLVPHANSLGFVLQQNHSGAPLFMGCTHYRDDLVSAELDPSDYRHGLVTDAGLLIREINETIKVDGADCVWLNSQNMKHDIGQ